MIGTRDASDREVVERGSADCEDCAAIIETWAEDVKQSALDWLDEQQSAATEY